MAVVRFYRVGRASSSVKRVRTADSITMIRACFENGMASRTQFVCGKHAALGPKKTWPRTGFEFKLPIENGVVGPNGSKIAVGTIGEVGVSCSEDDSYAPSTCSSVCGNTC